MEDKEKHIGSAAGVLVPMRPISCSEVSQISFTPQWKPQKMHGIHIGHWLL